jgi:hypothetical protein
MIYALHRSPQTRSQTVNASQFKQCFGAVAQAIVKSHVQIGQFDPNSYSNDRICQLFNISADYLELLRVQLFFCCALTPLVHYWQSGNEIIWSKSALWRLSVALGRSPDLSQAETLAIEYTEKPIALLPPAEIRFHLTSKAIAAAANISVSKLHRLRKLKLQSQKLQFKQVKTANNTIAYMWSDLGLDAVKAIVGGG